MENERERLKMNNFGKRNEKKIQLTLIDKTDTNANNGERREGESNSLLSHSSPSPHTHFYTLLTHTRTQAHTHF